MNSPFTSTEFLDTFGRYNDAIWPGQAILLLLGIIAATAAFCQRPRIAISILAALWLWMAAGYHVAFFAVINPAAPFFAVLFLVEAALLVWWTTRTARRSPAPSPSAMTAGIALLIYALDVYPTIGYFAGPHYPNAPTFGLPCPTTIFTFGIFCLMAPSVPRIVLAIPALWAVVGSYAAVRLSVPQDFALLIAAAVTVMVCGVPPPADIHSHGQTVRADPHRRESWSV